MCPASTPPPAGSAERGAAVTGESDLQLRTGIPEDAETSGIPGVTAEKSFGLADKAYRERIMASVTNSLNGLSYLMQTGGPLANLPASISAADLQSAPPQDVVSLSLAAVQMQQVNELFGFSSAAQDTPPELPISASTPAPGLANASPQEQATANNQAMLLQQVEGLFADPTSATGATSLIG